MMDDDDDDDGGKMTVQQVLSAKCAKSDSSVCLKWDCMR